MAILINGFEIDVAVTEEHSLSAEITDHPVESGSNIVDHVRPKPATVSIEGIVSDTPIGPIADRREGLATPSAEAYAQLLAIFEAGEPVSIQTSLRLYDNMALEQLSTPQSATTGDALRFTGSFREIVLVTNNRTTVTVEVPRAKKKVKRGNKPTQTDTPPPAQADEDSSVLADIGDFARKAFD